MTRLLRTFAASLCMAAVSLLALPHAQALTVTPVVEAGSAHSIALKFDGTVWTWGSNAYGQLGNGNNTDSSTPVQVKGLANVVAIAAGFYHNVVIKSDGTVWAWGNNADGRRHRIFWRHGRQFLRLGFPHRAPPLESESRRRDRRRRRHLYRRRSTEGGRCHRHDVDSLADDGYDR